MLYLHLVLLSQADGKIAMMDGFQMFLYSIRWINNGIGNHSSRKELLGGFLYESRNNPWVLFALRFFCLVGLVLFFFLLVWALDRRLCLFLLHLQVWKMLIWEIQLLFCSVADFPSLLSCLFKSIHGCRSRFAQDNLNFATLFTAMLILKDS